jgi:hypothetical protein
MGGPKLGHPSSPEAAGGPETAFAVMGVRYVCHWAALAVAILPDCHYAELGNRSGACEVGEPATCYTFNYVPNLSV